MAKTLYFVECKTCKSKIPPEDQADYYSGSWKRRLTCTCGASHEYSYEDLRPKPPKGREPLPAPTEHAV